MARKIPAYTRKKLRKHIRDPRDERFQERIAEKKGLARR